MVGEKIRKLRKEKKLTLKDIAEATGLSIGYISQLERGAVEPSLSSLRKVSEFLGFHRICWWTSRNIILPW